MVDGGTIIVIDYKPFRADGSSLHHHSCAAGDKKQDFARPLGQPDHAVTNVV